MNMCCSNDAVQIGDEVDQIRKIIQPDAIDMWRRQMCEGLQTHHYNVAPSINVPILF
jgi:hypothetical protein